MATAPFFELAFRDLGRVGFSGPTSPLNNAFVGSRLASRLNKPLDSEICNLPIPFELPAGSLRETARSILSSKMRRSTSRAPSNQLRAAGPSLSQKPSTSL
jgi:hypothetical protein